jgi:glyoxylase-like metal-dependent hydrolase (beta-lactamase superfamily II)/rhodanese-related sulfurtransferase
MYFKQLLHEDCGCSSYIVGSHHSHEVAVIDPALDIDQYIDTSHGRDFHIRYVIDTHIHADHVSGARALAERTGAELCLGAGADVLYPFRALHDGDELPLGNVTLRVMHTPGHRPESISLLVTNTARAEEPSMVITGDTLLVGDVGRPDFGGEEGARALWGSVQRLLALPDWVEVFPAHFEGSCGKGMCGRPSTTIGFERRFNPVLQTTDREEFVRRISTEIPARPLNMEAIVATNRGAAEKPWAMPRGGDVPEIDVHAARERLARGALLIDVREPHEYRRFHVPGACLIPQSELAARIDEVPNDREVLVICAGGVRSLKAAAFLKQQGLTNVASVAGGSDGWREAGMPVESGEPAAI